MWTDLSINAYMETSQRQHNPLELHHVSKMLLSSYTLNNPANSTVFADSDHVMS